MIDKYIERQFLLVNAVKAFPHKRYLYHKINWKNRLIGIVGSRGIGKTTLLLQYYCENFKTPEDCLYLSADNISVISNGLYSIAEEFFKYGGKTLLIDEVHKYPQWELELKNIYDSFPSKKVVFSGSSSIHILKGKADLSRRVVIYRLKGLSFREFLILSKNKDYKVVNLKTLLSNHIDMANTISSQLPVLRYFRDYLKFGYYPFFQEGVEDYFNKLNNAVEKILYEDIPALFAIKHSTIYSLKKLFYLVATSQPFIPNISRISSQLNISKEYIYAYIEEMQKAGMFILLTRQQKGLRLLRKPEKIFLENTNLFSLVEEEKGFLTETGSKRETFFINQMLHVTNLYYTEKADFLDKNGNYYEIGGKDKTGKSLSTERIPLSEYYLIKDDINIGYKNTLPLWLFGFLY